MAKIIYESGDMVKFKDNYELCGDYANGEGELVEKLPDGKWKISGLMDGGIFGCDTPEEIILPETAFTLL